MTLQERLRDLTAPCRDADAEIFNKMFLHTGAHAVRVGGEWLVDTQGTEHGICIPHYTASLDAAIELVERELPSLLEPEWSLENTDYGYWACVGNEYSTVSGQAHTLPAVALLLALIEAKGIE
jgi:hypothetical protein